MSTQPNALSRSRANLTLEYPMSVGRYDRYEEAQKAVDYLSDHEFPVQNLLIVGTDLKQLERVTGRLTRGRVPTSAHPLEVIAFRFLPSGRLADRVTRGRVAALQVPHRRGPLTIATRGLVRRAHAAGKHVHVWTIDDAEEIRELLDRGVDGVMTDRTDILKAVLVERGQWMSNGRADK